MSKYELTTILPNETTLNSASKFIDSVGGQIIREELVGKKKFAFPIKKLSSGVYHRIVFESEPNQIKAIDEALKHDSNVLRYLIVTQPLKAISAIKVDEAAIEKLEVVKVVEKKTERQSDKTETESEQEISDKRQETRDRRQEIKQKPEVKKQEKGIKEIDEAERKAALDKELEKILGK